MKALLVGTAAAAAIVAASPAVAATGPCSTTGTSFKKLDVIDLSCSAGKGLAKAADNKDVHGKKFSVRGYSCFVNEKGGKPGAGYCKQGTKNVTWFYK